MRRANKLSVKNSWLEGVWLEIYNKVQSFTCTQLLVNRSVNNYTRFRKVSATYIKPQASECVSLFIHCLLDKIIFYTDTSG